MANSEHYPYSCFGHAFLGAEADRCTLDCDRPRRSGRQLPSSCGLPELETELWQRLERHCQSAISTNRLVELTSFLAAYAGRPLPDELLRRLLLLAERDQLSTHRVNRLSRAVS